MEPTSTIKPSGQGDFPPQSPEGDGRTPLPDAASEEARTVTPADPLPAAPAPAAPATEEFAAPAAPPAHEAEPVTAAGVRSATTTTYEHMGAPQRELRHLVEGIRQWMAKLSGKVATHPGVLGILEGESGQGQREIIQVLEDVCKDLGVAFFWARTTACDHRPPGIAQELAAWLLALAENSPSESAPAPLSEDLTAELAWLASDGAGAGSSRHPLGVELDHSRLVDAMARALLESSLRRPIVLVIDDVESADRLTREILRQLLRLVLLRRELGFVPRLLLLALTEPGRDLRPLLECSDTALQELEAFHIRVRGLSRDDFRSSAERMLGSEGTLSSRERILRLTGGNARHLKWLLWLLREKGVANTAGVPESQLTLESIVLDRFRALPPWGQSCVAVASVAGVACGSSLLLATSGVGSSPGGEDLPPGAARGASKAASSGWLDRLEALAASGWLVRIPVVGAAPLPSTTSTSEHGEVAFAVADAEVADVVIASLDPREQQRLRQRIIEVLLLDANASRAARGLALDQAIALSDTNTILALAPGVASRLIELACPEAASEVVQEALDAAPQAPRTATVDLRQLRADVLEITRDHRAAAKAYADLATEAASAEDRAQCLKALGDVHGKLGERESQEKAYHSALASLPADAAWPQRIQLLAALARLHLDSGKLEESVAFLDRCLEAVAHQSIPAELVDVEVYRLAEEVQFRRNNLPEAIEFERGLLRRAELRQDGASQLDCMLRLANLHGLRSELEENETYLLESVRVARATGSRWLLARALLSLGDFRRSRQDVPGALKDLRLAAFVLLELGKVDASRRVMARILGLEFEAGHFSTLGRTSRAVVKDWCAQGELTGPKKVQSTLALDAAARKACIQQLEASPQEMEKRIVEMVHLLEADGRFADAQRLCREALREENRLPAAVANSLWFCLGRTKVVTGDYEGALGHFEKALVPPAGGQPSRDTLAEAYLEVSSVFLERGDIARAYEYGLRGIRLALEHGDAVGTLRALHVMAAFLAECGEENAAVMVGESLIHLARQMELPQWEIRGRHWVVKASTRHSGPSASAGTILRWIELASRLDMPVETCRLKLEAGWSSYYRREFVEAQKLAREGIEIARAYKLDPLLDELLHLVGVIESAAKNPRKNFLRALEVLEQALISSEARRRPRLRWEILKDMALVYRERGKDDLAEEFERRAQELELVASSSLPLGAKRLGWTSRARAESNLEPSPPATR